MVGPVISGSYGELEPSACKPICCFLRYDCHQSRSEKLSITSSDPSDSLGRILNGVQLLDFTDQFVAKPAESFEEPVGQFS